MRSFGDGGDCFECRWVLLEVLDLCRINFELTESGWKIQNAGILDPNYYFRIKKNVSNALFVVLSNT